MIYTGGTIGVSEELSGNIMKSEGTGQFLFDMFLDKYPHLNEFYELKLKRYGSLLSENIVPEDWESIARSIAAEVNAGADGIVVAHGTDSLAFTSSAISFMLQDIPIPVVFTGSMHPPDRAGTDAIQNLHDSVPFSAESELSGVYVVFKSKDESRDIFSGTRIESIPPYEDQFKSSDNKTVGKINNGIIDIFGNEYPKRHKLTVKYFPRCEIEPNIAFFKIFPGFDPFILKRAHQKGVKGIILDLYHSGTACTRKDSSFSLVPVVSELSKKIPIFGKPFPDLTEKSKYSSTNELQKAGLIPLKRMSNESSITKLMCMLGRIKSKGSIRSA